MDEFKTQVLLLHSEQTTLDNLSSGFGDRYTVHCATSGSEALNTLGDTPINVIITAQDLPGMSGLDALREAKKRSPDTIGILLTGNKTSDIEALVGDEEVYKVVSGNVTGDGLLQLVEKATRQLRLMALAQSANDTTADVEDSAEHIVMETSENGSTIISAGMTGRMPALDAKNTATTSVGSRSVDILVLTKDEEFLETIKDSSRGMHKVYYADTLAQANEAIAKHKIGVGIVDAALVGDKIEQLTQHLRKSSPRLVSIVAGRRDDGEMLMDLINRGKVYRFLLKPVSPGRARLAVESSVKHHLEAPDAAFTTTGVEKTSSAAAVKPVAKKAATAKPPATDINRIETSADNQTPSTGANAVSDPPLGDESPLQEDSPINAGLGDAFDEQDRSFTETVTGLIGSVSRGFSSESPSTAMQESDLSANAVASADSDTAEKGTLFRNPKFMGVAAAAVVVVAGLSFWLLGGSDATTPKPNIVDSRPPSFAESDVVIRELPANSVAVDASALLLEARLARDAGQIFNPEGSNAIELFAEAKAADAGNLQLAAEFDAVLSEALSMAETAMLEARIDDADAALQRVSIADSENARLPFLTAQLSQMQLRARLDDARVAIRETRFEDAAVALAAARSLNVADTSEIDAVSDELYTARSEQQSDEVLVKAAARLESGNLLSPTNDNARYYYELVLSNDPQNAVARQGLTVIAGKLAFQARTEIENGDLNLAEDTLASARGLDPTNTEIASTAAALGDARAAIETLERQRQAELQAAAEQAAIDEAQRLAALEEAERLAAENAAAATDVDASNGTQSDATVATPGSTDSESPAPDKSNAPSSATTIQNDAPAAISALNRTKYVSPKYPRSAQRRNVSGWVDVIFTVQTDGTVTNVTVNNSEPGETFVNAAVKAVEKWEFEPIIKNGVTVEKRAGVRLMFALE